MEQAEPPETEGGAAGAGAAASSLATDAAVAAGGEGAAPSVARSATLMSAATLLSRATGFIRTWAMAFALGNTLLTSAYSVANNLPNQLFELLAGGVFSSVFLPVYLAERERRGAAGAAGYASNIFSLSLVVLGGVSVLATLCAPGVVFTQTFLTQGLAPEAARMAVFFFRFFAIQVLFYGLGSLLGSLLNAHREFVWPMLGPIFNNLVVIVTMLGYPAIAARSRDAANVWLAVGTSLGVAVLVGVQVPAFLRLKVPLRLGVRLRDPALLESLRMALPVSVFVLANLVTVSVLNAVSLRVAVSGPATIQYAWLWYQLPYGVIAVSLSTALFTEMSEASAAGDLAKLREDIGFGLRTTLFAIIPLATAVLVLARQLAGLYHAGEFTADDVRAVAQVLAAWCLALPCFSAYRLMYRVFSALRDLRAFIAVDACGRVLQVLLYLLLTGGFGGGETGGRGWPGLGLVGLPLSDAIAHLLLLLAVLAVLDRRIGHFGLRRILLDALRCLAAAGLAAALPAACLHWLGWAPAGIGWSLVALAGWGLYMLVAYYWLCRLMRVEEVAFVDRLLQGLRRRVRRA